LIFCNGPSFLLLAAIDERLHRVMSASTGLRKWIPAGEERK
jgi:hypothetical protein